MLQSTVSDRGFGDFAPVVIPALLDALNGLAETRRMLQRSKLRVSTCSNHLSFAAYVSGGLCLNGFALLVIPALVDALNGRLERLVCPAEIRSTEETRAG